MSHWELIRRARHRFWLEGFFLALAIFSLMASVLGIVYLWIDPPDAVDAGERTLSGRLVDAFGVRWALAGGTAVLILVAILLFLWVAFQARKMRNGWGAPLAPVPDRPIWRIHSSPPALFSAEVACVTGSVAFLLVAAWIWTEPPSARDVGRHTFAARLVEIFGPEGARPAGIALFVALAVLMAVVAAQFRSRLSRHGLRPGFDSPA